MPETQHNHTNTATVPVTTPTSYDARACANCGTELGHTDLGLARAEAAKNQWPASHSGDYSDMAALLAETRWGQWGYVAGWDIPGDPPHMPWVEVSQTPCPGGGWLAVPDGAALVCRHGHYHPKADIGQRMDIATGRAWTT